MGNMELLCTQCMGIRPYLVARGKSHGFSRVAMGTRCTYSSYGGDGHSKPVFVQQRLDSCVVMRDTSGISMRLGRAIRMLLEVRRETQCPFLLATVILGFLSIFKKSQVSSPLAALNSACLLRCQRDVRPPVQMRRGPMAFFKVYTGDSDNPSSCEMEDEPAIKPLLGNPTFFQVRASLCPFHLRKQAQGPSHIPIAEGILLLMCLWKVGLPFQSKPWNHLSSRVDLGVTELSSSCYAEIGVRLDLR